MITLALTVVYIIVMHSVKGETVWYDTVLIYPLGMFWCIYRDKVETLFRKKVWSYWATLAVMVLVYLACYYFRGNGVADIFKHILFSFIILLLTMKVQINNKLLNFCGRHLFSIYILQRLPMFVLNYFNVAEISAVLYIAVTVIVTLLICVPFDIAMQKLDSLLFKKKTEAVKN